MALESGRDDEPNLHLLFGRCLSGKAAIDSVVSLAVPLHDSAAETARKSFCSFDTEVQLEVAWGKLYSFGSSEGDKGWLMTSNSRLTLVDPQRSIVPVPAPVHSKSLLIRFEFSRT